MALESNLVTYLKTQSGITSLIGSGTSMRIYPMLMPPNTTMPAAVYQRISSPRDYHLTGPLGRVSPRIQIDVYAEKYSEVKSLADAFRSALNGYTGTMGSITCGRCILESESDGPYEATIDYYRIRMEFSFSHTE